MIIKTNLIKVKIKLLNKGTIKVDHRNISRANDHISGLNVFVEQYMTKQGKDV